MPLRVTVYHRDLPRVNDADGVERRERRMKIKAARQARGGMQNIEKTVYDVLFRANHEGFLKIVKKRATKTTICVLKLIVRNKSIEVS